MSRNPIIIAYDISANATRRQIYKILLEWRLDGQKSVHECVLSITEAQELFIQLGQAIDPATDRLLLAWVAPRRPLYTCGVGRVDALFTKLLNIH
ncbi:MAG: CRISPR-associated endonuclease Cas2 [Phycisphaerales bacterium]|nr:CRISPR-associated endonuclease Cas2 [Phycisphaerales bacterium]